MRLVRLASARRRLTLRHGDAHRFKRCSAAAASTASRFPIYRFVTHATSELLLELHYIAHSPIIRDNGDCPSFNLNALPILDTLLQVYNFFFQSNDVAMASIS